MPRKPKDDESRDEYIPFCISWMIENGEYPNTEKGRAQAAAHCHSIYDEHGTGKSDDKYTCECIECGKKIKSSKHCNELTCPECGGRMRREERPGIGRKSIKVPMNIKGNLNVISKSKDKPHIIAGYASVVEIDIENQYIPASALEKGIKSLLEDECFANLNLRHSNIQIGKILKEYGKLKTHVDEIGLFIVAEVRQDLEISNQVWKRILNNELRSFSIAGEIIETHKECDDKQCYEVIDELNIFEVTVCEKPKNTNSGFTIISKNVCNECEKIDDTMTKKEVKDTKKESEDCEDCDVEEKESSEDKFSDFERRIKAIEETVNQIANSEDESQDEEVTEEKGDDEVTLKDISEQISEIVKSQEETDTEEPEPVNYPYPQKSSDDEDWHQVIANAIDDLYDKIATIQNQEEEEDEDEPEESEEPEGMPEEDEEEEEEDEEMKSKDTESKSEEDTEEKSDEPEKSENTEEKSEDDKSDENVEKSDDKLDMSDEKEIKYAIKSRDEAIQGYEEKIDKLSKRIKELENAELNPQTKVEKSDDEDSYDYSGIIKKGGTIYKDE